MSVPTAPAVMCGLFGFKPSAGATIVDHQSDFLAVRDLVAHHVFTHSVRDSPTAFAIARQAITGQTVAPVTVLPAKRLRVPLPTGADRPFAVDGLSFRVEAGEIVRVVGASGSGKTIAAQAAMRLLHAGGLHVSRGAVRFKGDSIEAMTPASLQQLRGNQVSMIFQEPAACLDPLLRVGRQVLEGPQVHSGRAERQQLAARVLSLFEAVGLPKPSRIGRRLPHQLSGGQCQRVMIAMALANAPDLLIANEPTTALDVTTQRQVLDLILTEQRRRGMSVLFITHGLSVVSDIADHVIVMQHGRIVEQGPAQPVLQQPAHDYTRSLLAAVLPLRAAPPRPVATDPVLHVRELTKRYRASGWLLRSAPAPAVGAVNIDLRAGESLALVGESGSGKSTLARLILRLIEPDSGQIQLANSDLLKLSGAALRRIRSQLQVVFQDPLASLNPRLPIGQQIARGPMAAGVAADAAHAQAAILLERVGLDRSATTGYPHEFSGGQCQRIAIASALTLNPRVLIADEAVSALDVLVQATILDLLLQLGDETGLALLFITHDLRIAARMADRIAVMHRGRVVETGSAREVLEAPHHEYTRALISAVPGHGVFRRGDLTELLN